MSTAQECETSLLCSIELWFRFAYYTFAALCRGGSPLTIRDRDILARQLFSGSVKQSGKIEVGAFIASASSGFGISLDRWSKAPERLFKALGREAGKKRRPQNFKGFALFDAADLKSVHVKNEQSIYAVGVPTKGNPFHANISLPPDRGKSFYMLVAIEILNKTKPQALLYK
jgi:hypothetical protein